MRVITTEVFPFNELSEEAKQKAVESLYDINVDHEWWDSIYDDAKNIGLKITSFDLDRNRHAKGDIIESCYKTAKLIIANHGENCDTYKLASSFIADYDALVEKDEVVDLEDDFKNALLEDYSTLLQKESERLQSDESIIETIEANEYEFTIDGKKI